MERVPGIKPGPIPWKGMVLSLNYTRFGGPRWVRTNDHLLKREMLYQLS